MRVVDCGLFTTLVQKSTQGTACVGSGGQHPCKWQAFVGADAIGSGRLTRGQLRWNYTAVHPGVYLPNGAERTIHVNAVAAWLWTGRKGIIASRAAAALHGARWVDASTPIEIIAENTRKRGGVIVRESKSGPTRSRASVNYPSPLLPEPPSTWPDSCLVTSRWRIWMQLTGVSAADAIALAARYPGTRGIRRARVALALMDGGAQSPKETWLRLVLIDGGLPRPRTQIRVSDGVDEAFIDLGYDEPMVGLDYDGAHHSKDRG